jgi:hypothetical protein
MVALVLWPLLFLMRSVAKTSRRFTYAAEFVALHLRPFAQHLPHQCLLLGGQLAPRGSIFSKTALLMIDSTLAITAAYKRSRQPHPSQAGTHGPRLKYIVRAVRL